MKNFFQTLKRVNWVMLIAMLALVAVGTLAIRSAGGARVETVFHDAWKANLATAAFGLVVYAALAAFDYRRFVKFVAWPGYAVSLLLLVLVLVCGSTVYGGKRWLWFFQPSEVAKVSVVVLFAALYGAAAPRLRGFAGAMLAGALLAAPVGLIVLEPDLGTALTLVPAVIAMLFVAGVWRRGLATVVAALVLAAAAILGAVSRAEAPGVTPEERARILRYVPLKEHQVKRVKVFLDPGGDPAGSGYNLRQSLIAIGSGGLRGKGLGRGDAHGLKYLPPVVSMNDFVFCVWAEETGFLGSLVLLGLYGVLLVSALWTAFGATDGCGRLLAAGVATLVFAHVFVNVAMSVGLVPITGLPLPFVSAGRTFLASVMAALGLVQSVAIHGRNAPLVNYESTI